MYTPTQLKLLRCRTTTRQVAKGHTFAPLFGASGFGRSKAEAEYYKHFNDKYQGIAKWHTKLGDEAVDDGKITTPSGRQYAFPDVIRRQSGQPTFYNDKELPCQGFCYRRHCAYCIFGEMDKRLEPLNSALLTLSTILL